MKKKFYVFMFIFTLSLLFIPNVMAEEDDVYDFTINGKSYTNKVSGDTIVVNASDDFSFDNLEQFYVSRIVKNGRTYTFNADEYGIGKMEDEEERDIVEANFKKVSSNCAILRVIGHAGDIQDKDVPADKNKDDFPEYYITKIVFVKENAKGAIEVSANKMPDNYSFEVFNGAELGDTTMSKPGIVSAYYGSNVINFNLITGTISKIELVSGKGVPNSAVSIDTTNKVTVKSNFYNVIPLKITLTDGTVGYINIERIGIFISTINANETTFYHGAELPLENNFMLNRDKQRIAATFYHESSYSNYDLVVNLTYEDGTTETKLATPVENDILGRHALKGSDYELWSGSSMAVAPKKVSVIAVKHGALSNSTTFGGATFGAGAGVEWVKD